MEEHLVNGWAWEDRWEHMMNHLTNPRLRAALRELEKLSFKIENVTQDIF